MTTLSVRPSIAPKGSPLSARRISRINKPPKLALEEWQVELRRQFGREHATEFVIRNLGHEPVFSEFAVTNPASGRTYRVAVRGEQAGVNFCSCPDYSVNTLGTCKHIEATLHRLRARHEAKLRNGYQPPFAEIYVRYGTQRSVMFSAGAKCSPALRKLANHYFRSDGALDPRVFPTFDRFAKSVSESGEDVRIYDDAAALIAEVRDGQARRARVQKRYGRGRSAAAWNRLLKVPLYPYQMQGALFAVQAGRAVIADEMGLGKTIQAIAAAEILARDGGVERTLILCPASLKSQWHYEIAQFSSRPALIIDGATHRRKQLYLSDPSFFKIANYDVVHRDLDAIAAWSPDLVILDEAQRIKNWQTRTAKSVKQIESRFAIVLTGTPLENRLEELHSIVEFVDRFRLGPLFAFKAAHEVQEEGTTKTIGYRDLHKISKTLSPILIRRTKKEVLSQLPPRMDKNFFVPMTEEQWVPHRENQDTVARLVAKWRKYKFLAEADQLRLRIALQYMRMACDNTYLVDHETKYGTKVDELAVLLEEVFEDRNAKVVIFSQWVRMNELVEVMLEKRDWGHVHLHGGVPSGKRKDLTRALREDAKCRVFLSTDAGGVGLNLQTASAVINMDLPWNPAVLEQRIGRVHRLGQKQPVRVVNFISEGTIEHGMLSLLSFKRSLFAGVLDGAADKVFMGDSAMNRFMKTVETATSSVPISRTTPVVEDGNGGAGAAPMSAAVTQHMPNAPASFDVQMLGDFLTQGAAFLQTLGRAMTQPKSGAGSGKMQTFQPMIETDTKTGRRELRIALPDESILRELGMQLAGWLGDKGVH